MVSERTPAGILLAVQAQPGSKKNEIKGVQNGFLKVAITQIAEQGKANRVLTEFLAKSLGVKKSQVELVSGETSTKKRFLLSNVTPEQIDERIAQLSSPTR